MVPFLWFSLAIAGIAFNYLFVLPVLVYYVFKWRRLLSINASDDKNEPMSPSHSKYIQAMLSSRNATLLCVMFVLSMIILLVERPLVVIQRVLLIEIMPSWVLSVITILLLVGLLFLYAIKAYHLFFTVKYNMLIADIEWRQRINPFELDSNWYFKNTARFGNIVWLMKIALIPYTVMIAAEFLQIVTGNKLLFALLHLMDTSVPLVFFIVISIRLYAAKHTDIYNLHTELFCQFLIWLFVVVAYSIIWFALNAIQAEHILQIQWTLTVWLVTFMLFSLMLMNLRYPLYVINQFRLNSHKKLERVTSDSQSDREHRLSIAAMKACIGHYDGYKLFMQHLVEEFACETLLFLTELIQIKHEYQRHCGTQVAIPRVAPLADALRTVYAEQVAVVVEPDDDEDTDDETRNINMNMSTSKRHTDADEETMAKSASFVMFNVDENSADNVIYSYLFHGSGNRLVENDADVMITKVFLPSTLPKSWILQNCENDFYQQMQQLYEKYIKEGSMHEINISCELRESLRIFFHGIEDSTKKSDIATYKLFTVMDECGVEMIEMLHEGYQRFTYSEKYEEYQFLLNGMSAMDQRHESGHGVSFQQLHCNDDA